MKKYISFALIALLLLSGLAMAQEKRAMTVEDLWKMKRVSAPKLSPDGNWLAFTLTTYVMEDNKGASDIWLLSSDGETLKQLTTHNSSDSSPIWSPCSKFIAFTSNRDEHGSQIYIINVEGGEATRLTNISTGISNMKWTRDGSRIYFVSNVWQDAADDAENKERLDSWKGRKSKAVVTDQTLFRYFNRYIDHGRVPMLHYADAKSGEFKNVMKASGKVFDVRGSGSYDISPDGKEIAMVINNVDNIGLDSNSDIFLMPADGGEAVNITAANLAGDSSPVYSSTGRYIAYTSTTTPRVPEYGHITLYDRDEKTNTRLKYDEPFESSAGNLTWGPDDVGIMFTAGVEGLSTINVITLDGRIREIHRENTLSGIQISPDGSAIYGSHQSISHPTRLFRLTEEMDSIELMTHFNDELIAELEMHSVEVHKFAGAGGDEVQMFLLKPADFDPAKKYPLVHLIHGGPHGNFGDSFHYRWNAQLFAAPGYVVSMVNFHGSSSFGQKFYDSIAGREADKPYADMMAATDYLLGTGYIDKNKMAAGGGSYGAYLSNWIATQTDRFAALFTHAGGFNHWGMWASDGPKGRERRWGGLPWLAEENVLEQSPNVYAENIKTPMLVLHGEIDYRVVVTQGIELYNTLQILGVPSRLVLFPDEGHWIMKPQNAKVWWNEVHAWLANYIGQ
jgi:dipeptidyl aminopeptidase/acylaminoacyl peptidase